MPDFPTDTRTAQKNLDGADSALELRVRAYSQRRTRWAQWPAGERDVPGLSIFDAEILTLAAAKEIEPGLAMGSDD